MKATELVKKINKLIEKHGDVEVLTRYDSRCLNRIYYVHYRKKIEWNYYSEFSDLAENVIVLFDND